MITGNLFYTVKLFYQSTVFIDGFACVTLSTYHVITALVKLLQESKIKREIMLSVCLKIKTKWASQAFFIPKCIFFQDQIEFVGIQITCFIFRLLTARWYNCSYSKMVNIYRQKKTPQVGRCYKWIIVTLNHIAGKSQWKLMGGCTVYKAKSSPSPAWDSAGPDTWTPSMSVQQTQVFLWAHRITIHYWE